jgi:hypothetical protein
MTKRERATVLAALRYWQRVGLEAGGQMEEADIAAGFGTLEALNAEEIDALAERIRAGETERVESEDAEPPMAPAEAEQLLRAKFTAADADEIKTYVWGPGDLKGARYPADYFSKIANVDELFADFETFMRSRAAKRV